MLVQNAQRSVQRGCSERSVVHHPAPDLRLDLGSQLPQALAAAPTQRPTLHLLAHPGQCLVADCRPEGREDPSCPAASAPGLEREAQEVKGFGLSFSSASV